MSKKNRAKSKAKRFGEGSAKPIVSAATYGVGGNAFAQAIADPVSTVHSNKPELLVVDGYNVIHCTPRYEKLVYDHSDDPYSSDVHDMARTALINDVAAFAQGRYEAVIVFDGAGNISSERPNLPARGVRIEFSPTGVSADTVVQKLCIEAREEGRACSVVSSDGTIQAVVMGKGVTRISSRMLVDEIKQIDNDVHEAEEAPQIKMTLGSRLSPEALAKLKALRGDGIPICSFEGGYYYAATAEELERTIRQLRSRIKKIAFAERGLSSALPDYVDTGQLSLPLDGGDAP